MCKKCFMDKTTFNHVINDKRNKNKNKGKY